VYVRYGTKTRQSTMEAPNFVERRKGEVRRIPLLRTWVNSALEELEDGLVDRGVPFDS
jgi:hypothetical protein